MRKHLVRSQWLFSVLLAPWTAVFAADALILNQADLYRPEIVSAWLIENAADADQGSAQWFFDQGSEAKKRKDWGLAGKGFGEAAIRYPTPQSLSEAAEVQLRMLGEMRHRNKDIKVHMEGDLSGAESLYRSALAADSVLNSLSDEDRKQLQRNAECVREFIESSEVQTECAPLQAYGIK